MPRLPDLLADDSPPSPTFLPAVLAGNAPNTVSKLKSKKKKNAAAMEQPVEKKAPVGISRDPQSELEFMDSPALAPTLSPPNRDPSPPLATEPSNRFTSPVLNALGEQPFVKTTGYDTESWANNVPFGVSPPSRPQARVPSAAAAASPPSVAAFPQEEIRGGFARSPPTTSPHLMYRTVSRQSVSGQNNIGTYLPSSPRGRPLSMPSNYPEPALAQYLPPRAYPGRDTSADFKSRSSSRRSSDKEFVAFDVIPPTTDNASTTGELALLAAAEESLHIFKVDREGVHRYGYIEGLRGQIIAAKLIPNAMRNDQLQNQRPLIAIVVHGIISASSNVADSQHSEFDPSESIIQTMQAVPHQESAPRYQTTVELYSLRDRSHIATLYRSPVLDLELRPGERYPEPPSPFGILSIQAKGRFIVITSSTSGEVFIYEAIRSISHQAVRCIGKTWTSIQGKKSRTWSTSSGTSEKDHLPDTPARAKAPTDIALVSLSNRWLAIVPPIPGSRSTLHGSVDHRIGPLPHTPGLKSHTSPSQPNVTCELDTPLEDSRLNRVARDVTQEVLKGARWVGDQGIQAWKNYWNKPEEASSQEQVPMPTQQQFPPTHADESVKASNLPTLVSILDLERLSENQASRADTALQPLATFSLTDGCSFLSFSPSGLNILTATAKGDVCYAWDLMRMVYGKSMTAPADSQDHSKAVVRQVAKFGRVTIANIVDVVWAEPKGEKLAIVTDRGTIHVHDLPQTAFQWPPPARPKRIAQPRKISADAVTGAVPPPPSGFGAAFSAVSGGAQPILAAVRGSGLPSWSNFNLSAASAGASVKGGRIVSSGLSKSMGAASGTVDSILRMGESRLHLPGSARAHAIGSARWIHTKDATAIAVVGGGKIRLHSILSNADVKGRKRHSVVGLQLVEFSLPKIKPSSNTVSGDGLNPNGHWPDVQPAVRTSRGTSQPISYAELESSAPYQPFHMDQRITLSVYDPADLNIDDQEPWLFGQPIRTTHVMTSEDDSEDAQLGPEAVAPMDNLLDIQDEISQPIEYPMSTTAMTATATVPIINTGTTKGKKKKSKKGPAVIQPQDVSGEEESGGAFLGDFREEGM